MTRHFVATLLTTTALAFAPLPALADDPAALSDTEIAHVAYTADNIDIRYAHLALALSTSPEIQGFANTMIRDHTAVNTAALALLHELGATAEDNFLSQQLMVQAEETIDRLAALRGDAFDLAYAQNELAYHQAVIGLVEDTFIPNIENDQVRALFEQGLEIFRAHEGHAATMVEALQ